MRLYRGHRDVVRGVTKEVTRDFHEIVDVGIRPVITGVPIWVKDLTPFEVTVTFPEDVTGFGDVGDILANNATVGPISTVNASTYTANITPTGGADVSVWVPAGAAQDSESRPTLQSKVHTAVWDSTAPSCTITAPPAHNGSTPYTAQYAWDEPVTGFTLADINAGLTGATASDFTETVTGQTWTVTVTPTAVDTTLSLAAGAATDRAGNSSNAAGPVTVTYDSTVPATTISNVPARIGPNQNQFKVAIAFTKDVTGFTIDGLNATNATKSNFVQTDARNYTIDVTGSNTGNVVCQVPAGAAQDSLGNDNTASNTETATYDDVRPSCTITNVPALIGRDASFEATITFSKDVTGFVVGDISVGNATLSGFIADSASVYRVTATANNQGNVTLQVPENVAVDDVANQNTASNLATAVQDLTRPSCTITGVPPTVNLDGSFTATMTFSKDVTGFVVGDINVTNGTKSDFTPVSASEYTVLVTASNTGDVSIQVPENVAQDSLGNQNTASAVHTATLVSDRPIPVITDVPAEIGISGSFVATITFDEGVTGFVVGDIAVTNAALSEFTQSTPAVYTVRATADNVGNVTMQVPADVANSIATGNPNLASNLATAVLNTSRPSCTITGVPATVGRDATFTATITFNEDVTGFEQGDITVGNAVLSNFQTVSASQYTVLVSGDNVGNITLQVPENSAQNSVGNGNTVSNLATAVLDLTEPTVSITGVPATIDPGSSFTATITFSEDVTGFTQSDISVGNATLSEFTVTSPSIYTVKATTDNGGDLTLQVPAGVAHSISLGNPNQASSLETAALQITTTITGVPANIGIDQGFVATITFGLPVTNFVQTDITVGNATLSGFNGTGTTYTVTVTANNAGNVTIQVPAGVADGPGGTVNLDSGVETATFKGTRPSCTISGLPANHDGSTPFTITYTWDEDVTGFTLADVNAGLTNATGGSFTNTTPNRVWTAEITPTGATDITIELLAGAAADTVVGNTSSATAPQTVPHGSNLDDQMAALNSTAWLDQATLNTGYVARNLSGPNAAANDPVGSRTDRSGTGNNALANADDQRPILDLTASVYSEKYDGANDRHQFSIVGSAGLADCSAFLGLRTLDVRGTVLLGSNENTQYMLFYWNFAGSTPHAGVGGSTTTYADGILLPDPTLADIFNILQDGNWHIFEMRNADLSQWSEFKMNGYGGQESIDGRYGPLFIIPTANFSASDRDNTILPWFRERLGIT